MQPQELHNHIYRFPNIVTPIHLSTYVHNLYSRSQKALKQKRSLLCWSEFEVVWRASEQKETDRGEGGRQERRVIPLPLFIQPTTSSPLLRSRSAEEEEEWEEAAAAGRRLYTVLYEVHVNAKIICICIFLILFAKSKFAVKSFCSQLHNGH